MPQFVLNWYAAPVMVNPNSIGQRASYRQKAVGGSFITTGFTPSNDLNIVAQTITSPNLAANKIWEFKVEALCTSGGPTINNNGIQEALKFACISPTLSSTTTTVTAQLNITGLDITKAQFTLHKVSDNSTTYGPVTNTPSGSIIQAVATGQTPDTAFYWEIILYTTLNGVEIASNTTSQLNSSCLSANISTIPDACVPITDITAIAIETA